MLNNLTKHYKEYHNWWLSSHVNFFLLIIFSLISLLLVLNKVEKAQLSGQVLGATNVSFTLNAGTLNLTSPSSTTLSNPTVSSSTQTATGNLGTLTSEDNRGSGAGWTLSMSAANFSCCSGSHTIAVTNFTVTPGSVTVNAGVNDVSVGSAHTFSSPSDQTTLLSASSNQGMGSYSLNPSLSLSIPVGTFAGNYSATVTTTLL